MDDLTVQPRARYHLPQVHKDTAQKKAGGFSEYVKEAVQKVSVLDAQAKGSVEQMIKGQVGIHETMIALEKAGISMRLLLQVRNKALEAYREIMRMSF